MKLIYRSIAILAITILGFTQNSYATHIAGGDISYVCIGQDSFLITLNLFRDCAGVNAPATASISFTSTCGGSATIQLQSQSSSEISQLCPTQIPNSTCNGGTFPGMEAHIYTGIVELSPPCNTWTMSWTGCCRNNQITNLTTPGGASTYLYTTMYSGVDTCNSSPTFTSLPIPYVCMNQIVNYNFGVVEPDGDSIVYFMSPGYESNTGLVNYSSTYTFNQPFPGANAVLNAFNGQLTFTPTAVGVYVAVVRIEEYERSTGVIKGTSIRDVQVVVQNCTNSQPTITSPGITNFTGSGTQIDSNTVEVCIGDSFSFDVTISDPDSLQTISLYHNIYQALDSTAIITITNGNPAVINIKWTAQPGSPPFAAFSVTGIDDACPVVGLVSAVFNIHIFPSTYAGPDQTICQGTQWTDIPVVGGSAFTWTTISGSMIDTIPTSPNFNMTCWHCDNPSVSPQVTTTYVVYSNLVSSCKSVDTVTIIVAPNFNLAMANDTLICPIDSINIPVVTDQPGFNYTYQWAPSAFMDFDNIDNPKVLPLASTKFRVTMTASGGCIKEGNMFVNLAPAFPPNISILGDTVICLGDGAQLDVVLGDVPVPYCGLSTSPCVGNDYSVTVGTGTLTNTNWSRPAPYAASNWGATHQMLFLASELHALGMTAGKIKSISLDVLGVGSTTIFNKLEVKIGCTSATDLAAGWETGLVTVLPGYSHNLITGWNKHQFTNNFDWDGISNLVVQICFNNSKSFTNGTAMTKYSATNHVSTRYYTGNNSSICNFQPFSTSISNRPNVRFGYCAGADQSGFSYIWSPNSFIDSINSATPIVSPGTTTLYTVIVQDTFGSCSDTVEHNVLVVTQFNADFILMDTICINGGTTIATPYVPNGIFSGNGIIDSLAGIFDPLAAGIGTWQINHSVSALSGGCLSDSAQNIVVIPLPDATFSPMEFCEGQAPDTLISVLPGGKWNGTGIVDTTYGIFDPFGLPVGSYRVTYILTEPCYNVDTQYVKIIEPYSFTFVNPIENVCEGSTIDLSNNYTLSSNPLQGSGPVIGTWSDIDGYINSVGIFDADTLPPGDYNVFLSVTDMNGVCGSTQSMIVTIQPIEYPTVVDNLVYCTNEIPAKMFINPWLFGTGVTYKQTPLSPLGATDTLTITAYGQNGQFDPSAVGIGEWALELTWVNTYGCVGVTEDTIYVLNTPEQPSPNPTEYCEGDEIILTATGSTPDSIYWHSDFNLLDTIGIGTPVYWGEAPHPSEGPITIFATQNNWECVSPKARYTFPLKESPVAKFEMAYTDTFEVQLANISHEDSPIYGFTPLVVNFTALNTVASDTIKWFHHWENQPTVPAEMNLTNSSDVLFNYSTANLEQNGSALEGAYINQLIVINEFGCSDTAQAVIYSVASEVFYNVFSPNGDGINDIFYMPVFGIKDYKVMIYNRWGKKVYEWADPTQGWTGEDQPDGVYFFVVTGIKNDAQETEYKKQGSVTLTGSGI